MAWDGAPQVVIVTGGAGYIGSHVCEALLRRGDAVVALDAFTPHYDPARKRANLQSVEAMARDTAAAPGSKERWPRGNFRFLPGDACRSVDLDATFAAAADLTGGAPPRRVLHLAGRASVRTPIEESPSYVSANVVATTEVLEACRRHGLGASSQFTVHSSQSSPSDSEPRTQHLGLPVGHLVIASSSSVYGAGPPGWDGPFREDLPADRPLSPYAATKRACELLAHVYARLVGLRVTCLRFFTVVGPRARPDLTPYLFTDAIWHGWPIKKFGDGSTARDYTFVGDTVAGVLAALDRFELSEAGLVAPGEPYEIVNLGSDRPVTLNTYLSTLERLLGKPAVVEQLPEQPVDPRRSWADLAKARRLLGYEPQTSFEQALASCVDWYRQEIAGDSRANGT
jgi:UDP-glucuronate 4-epimerase